MDPRDLGQFLLSAALIFLAARWLVKASDGIARLTGLGHLFVGGIFLAASTSSPEIFVDIRAALEGFPNLAAGDLLGSSLVNLSIFGALILLHHGRGGGISHAGVFSSILAAILTLEVGLLVWLKPDGKVLGFGVGGFFLTGTYLAGLYWTYRKAAAAKELESPMHGRQASLLASLLLFLAGTFLVFFASPWLVSSAQGISRSTGLGDSFIGSTLLAFTTSFPELAASVLAARAGHFQLAAGNIVGSNSFNMLIFTGLDFVWKDGSFWGSLAPVHSVTAFVVALNMLLLAALSLKFGREQMRWPGVLLLLSCLFCFGLIYVLR